MKFPYGVSNFYKIVTENYFFVDRTAYISLLENIGSILLFLRPRRFGKSMWLSILENYYDVAKTDDFERLFGNLAIGQNPTPNHNQYLIMRWDFSTVKSHGTVEDIEKALHDHINIHVRIFANKYKNILKEDIVYDPHNGLFAFETAAAAVSLTPYKLYLLIDEYDNFANEVLMSRAAGSRDRYESLVHGEGILRTLFKGVKSVIGSLGLDRIFMTGVSPIVMSDITSAFNIAEDIYRLSEFNDLCGFWEEEVETALQNIARSRDMPASQAMEALNIMRAFYNGYTFDGEQEARLYNPTLALYFLKYFQRYGQHPRKMLDSNFATDYNKIAYVSYLPRGQTLITKALDDAQSIQVEELADRFGVRQILRETQEESFMASLLYYLGVLTFNGFTAQGAYRLMIPNIVVRRLYAERFREMIFPDAYDRDIAREKAAALFQRGDMQPLCDFMEQRYFKVFDNRDYRWAKEMTIKTAFLTLLFNDIFYIMDSETALQRGYADLTMILRPDMRKFDLLDILIEFKYIKPQAGKVNQTEIAELPMTELALLKTVKKQLDEAKAQVLQHRHVLKKTYGDVLRLRSYVIVALGFERLVWEEI